jgi:hypothetical protein
MDPIYIIVENGVPYPFAYKTYADCVSAVKSKHKEYLEKEIKDLHDLNFIEELLADINVPENTETNITKLYIEKGIHIMIHKLFYL